MKKLNKIVVLAVVAGMISASCTKDSIKSSSSLGVKIMATNKTFSLLKAGSLVTPVFAWDTCSMNISKIDLEAEKKENESSRDSANIEIEWKGPKKVDLFSINSLVGDINLNPGLYDEISIKIEALKSDAGSSPVFYLSGSYTNATGIKTPIVVTVNDDIRLEVESKEGTELNAVNDYTSLINLNLALLMNGILTADLDNATLTNGKIIISDTSNTSLYTRITGNFDSCEDSEFNQE